MRASLLLPLLALFFCLQMAAAQMTFSDHWSKKSFPSRPSSAEPKEDSLMCKDEAYYEMKLDWLRFEMSKTQRELKNCRGGQQQPPQA